MRRFRERGAPRTTVILVSLFAAFVALPGGSVMLSISIAESNNRRAQQQMCPLLDLLVSPDPQAPAPPPGTRAASVVAEVVKLRERYGCPQPSVSHR